MTTVIRRRRGSVTVRVRKDADGQVHKRHRLGAAVRDKSIQEQLIVASERLSRALDGDTIVDSLYTLREKQRPAFEKLGKYFVNIASMREGVSRWCHIVWPPRTGKMVLFTEVIAACGLPVVIFQETRLMVEQTYNHIRKQLPTTPVGKYYGGEHDFKREGVTVTTYAMAQRYYKRHGRLPEGMGNAALVFCDEAHHTMTAQREEMLKGGFHPHTIRFALTATPDYDSQRALARFFPKRIDEITLLQAIEADLLAPMRFWVMGVDEDASWVEIVRGDYAEADLLRVMGSAPFFKAALDVRYDASDKVDPALGHTNRSCLITCINRQHARDCYEYFLVHRPANTPPPGLILSDTPTQEREQLMQDYEEGKIDTLICVAILLEGWSSERCKLLLDLAPSTSEVRAKQKLFRPMTRDGDAHAYVYQFMPKNLRKPAVLPTDLFGSSFNRFGSTVNFEPLKKQKKRQIVKRVRKGGAAQVDDVYAKVEILMESAPQQWTLDPYDVEQVRAVIATGYTSDLRVPSLRAFRKLVFDHPLFAGSGRELVRYCGVEHNHEAFVKFIQWVLPELAAKQFFRKHRIHNPESLEPNSCWMDFLELHTRAVSGVVANRDERVPEAWRAMGEPQEMLNPEEALMQKQQDELIRTVMHWQGVLTERERKIFIQHEIEGESFQSIGDECGLSGARVTQVYGMAVRKLQGYISTLLAEPFVHAWPEPTHSESPKYWALKMAQINRREHALRRKQEYEKGLVRAERFHTNAVERFAEIASGVRVAEDTDRTQYTAWVTIRRYYACRAAGMSHHEVWRWEFDPWERMHCPRWVEYIPEPAWVNGSIAVEIPARRPSPRWW
jgi:superfamily II DNA or RNA helicase